MITCFIKKIILYDGSQIESLWATDNHKIYGDSIVSFIGPCDILPEKIIDSIDRNKTISSPSMLHFIIEHFDTDIEKAVLRQRIIASLISDELESLTGIQFSRIGDDIWHKDRKLTISVATCGSVSSKIHFGINIKEAKNVDVKTAFLAQYKINPKSFAKKIMKKYTEEFDSIQFAKRTVRPIK